jgi:drug/metabolite transporter (DMT)-like permease
MIELWIPVTVGAGLAQCVRTALQKHLKGQLSTNGAGFVRFFYGFPFALIYVSLLVSVLGYEIPGVNLRFWSFALLGGVAQIVATSLLILVFSFRNFAVGTIYSKTEVVQTAIFGWLLFDQPLSAAGWLAILIGATGVMTLSLARTDAGLRHFLFGWTEKSALIGIASGFLFGVSALSIREASLALDGGGDAFIRAGFTLACITVLQTILMGTYLALREREQLAKVIATWRVSGLVGLTGVLGSAGWFLAMTLQKVAYVRTVGQVELVFTFIASYFFFKERASRAEIAGILLIVVGILVLLNFR